MRRLSATLFLALCLWPGLATARAVDLALVLAIDCSYSIDEAEFDQQRLGLAAAFLDARVMTAIRGGERGAILVTVVQWSSHHSQVLALPWIRVSGPREAAAVAQRLGAMERLTREGGTSISAALDFSRELLSDPAIGASRRVIDISGDGRNNNGRKMRAARDDAIAAGITVNGLAILNAVPTLDYYYRRDVLAGADSFVVPAASYVDYGDAVLRKLVREITGNLLSDAGAGFAKAAAGPLVSARDSEGGEREP